MILPRLRTSPRALRVLMSVVKLDFERSFPTRERKNSSRVAQLLPVPSSRSFTHVRDVCFPRTARLYMWEAEGKDCRHKPLGQSPYCSLTPSRGFRKEAMKSFPLD